MSQKTLDYYAVGQAVAKFMPADPEVWFEAASANGYWACCRDGWLAQKLVDVPEEVVSFFNGWLDGTPGGRRALGRFLEKQKIHRFPESLGEENWRPRGDEPTIGNW